MRRSRSGSGLQNSIIQGAARNIRGPVLQREVNGPFLEREGSEHRTERKTANMIKNMIKNMEGQMQEEVQRFREEVTKTFHEERAWKKWEERFSAIDRKLCTIDASVQEGKSIVQEVNTTAQEVKATLLADLREFASIRSEMQNENPMSREGFDDIRDSLQTVSKVGHDLHNDMKTLQEYGQGLKTEVQSLVREDLSNFLVSFQDQQTGATASLNQQTGASASLKDLFLAWKNLSRKRLSKAVIAQVEDVVSNVNSMRQDVVDFKSYLQSISPSESVSVARVEDVVKSMHNDVNDIKSDMQRICDFESRYQESEKQFESIVGDMNRYRDDLCEQSSQFGLILGSMHLYQDDFTKQFQNMQSSIIAAQNQIDSLPPLLNRVWEHSGEAEEMVSILTSLTNDAHKLQKAFRNVSTSFTEIESNTEHWKKVLENCKTIERSLAVEPYKVIDSLRIIEDKIKISIGILSQFNRRQQEFQELQGSVTTVHGHLQFLQERLPLMVDVQKGVFDDFLEYAKLRDPVEQFQKNLVHVNTLLNGHYGNRSLYGAMNEFQQQSQLFLQQIAQERREHFPAKLKAASASCEEIIQVSQKMKQYESHASQHDWSNLPNWIANNVEAKMSISLKKLSQNLKEIQERATNSANSLLPPSSPLIGDLKEMKVMARSTIALSVLSLVAVTTILGSVLSKDGL